MRRLPVSLMLAVSLAACSTASPQVVQPSPVVHPSPELSLTASLDRSSLQPGGSVQLNVELKNEGGDAALIPRDERCNPALQIIIRDSHDLVVWAQPLPLCAQPQQPPFSLAPGASLSAAQCFRLASDAGGFAGQCALLDLPVSTYWVGGSFYGMSLPKQELTRR